MSTDLTVKRIEQAERMERGLETVAASNRQPDSQLVPLAQRRSIITVGSASCRWPIGDPQDKEFFLCGAQTGVEQVYCVRHMKMAYAPPSKRIRMA